MGAEADRLAEDAGRTQNWKRWGPYLAERQWGTVREDYSEHGNVWEYSPTITPGAAPTAGVKMACSASATARGGSASRLALWNGRDPILKERLFGLTGPEGNHGEDVKEPYFYLDSTPTHSYLKALYKYPQAEFPYERLVRENRRSGQGRARVRAGRHRRLRRETATSTSSPSTPRPTPDDIADADHGGEPRARSGHAPPAAHALVPQHLELGP